MINAKYILLTLCLVSISIGLKAQRILLDKPIRAGQLTLFPEVQNESTYYYLPDKPKLAVNEQGEPSFSFTRYVKNALSDGSSAEAIVESETGGGLIHCLVELSVSDEMIKEAEQALRRIDGSGKIVGPVIFKSGTVALVSAVAQEGGKMTEQIVGLGSAPVLENQKSAVAIQLNKIGSKILWETFNTSTPDFSFNFEMQVEGYLSPKQVLIEADFDRIYKHKSFEVGTKAQGGPVVLAGEIKKSLDELYDSGAIKMTQIGEDEQLDKLKDAAYTQITNLMFNKIGGQGVAELSKIGNTGPGGMRKSMLDRASENMSIARSEARQDNLRIEQLQMQHRQRAQQAATLLQQNRAANIPTNIQGMGTTPTASSTPIVSTPTSVSPTTETNTSTTTNTATAASSASTTNASSTATPSTNTTPASSTDSTADNTSASTTTPNSSSTTGTATGSNSNTTNTQNATASAAGTTTDTTTSTTPNPTTGTTAGTTTGTTTSTTPNPTTGTTTAGTPGSTSTIPGATPTAATNVGSAVANLANSVVNSGTGATGTGRPNPLTAMGAKLVQGAKNLLASPMANQLRSVLPIPGSGQGTGNLNQMPKKLPIPSISVAASYQQKTIKRSGKYVIDLNKYTQEVRSMPFAYNPGNVKSQCKNCFHEVNLDDPLMQQREVNASLGGINSDDFNYINFINIILKKTHQNGDETVKELKIDKSKFNADGNLFRTVYGFKGDDDRDKWLSYDYRTMWSYIGGFTDETDWESTEFGSIALSPTVIKKPVYVEIDEDFVIDEEIRGVEIKFYSKLGEVEDMNSINLKMKNEEDLSKTVELLLPLAEETFEYQVTYFIKGQSPKTSQRMSTDYGRIDIDRYYE